MRLLILAYDFPPLISIGGLRPASWYKYFADFGVEVTVITRDWEYEKNRKKSGEEQLPEQLEPIIESGPDRKLIKVRFAPSMKDSISTKLRAKKLNRLSRGITYLFSFLEFLSLKFDSSSPLYHEADRLLQNEKFDYILVTGKPFILFRYASLLSEKYKTPWIADYRDSWTLNHIQGEYSLGTLNLVLNSFYKSMERKYVRTARLITTVAPSYIDFLPGYINRNKIKIVYNGYDDDIEKSVAGIPLSKTKFIISYAGIVYPMQRLEVFLEALCIFLKENQVAPEEFEVHFRGIKNDTAAVSRVMNYDPALQPYIHVHEKTDYFDVMKKISSSHLLLLLTSGSDSWLNAKLFDYLVLKRAILMVGSNTNVMSGILKETHGGMVAENAVMAASYITSRFKVYKEAEANDTINYKQYSRRNQTERFYMILKNLM